jgi:DNA polymerase elongation subunit (family B)
MTNYTKQILFIDIETCSLFQDFSELSSKSKLLWAQKCKWFLRDKMKQEHDEAAHRELYRSKAAIYAEFGKVICISVAFTSHRNGVECLEYWSFCHTNERLILQSFACFLTEHPELKYFCGHNIREFDIPYLARRYSVHGLCIPRMLNLRGKKPWEVKHLIDTMEWWKFGDYKNYTSLQLLAEIFNLGDPKATISGADIHELYWEQNALDRIKSYCENDVRTVFKLYHCMGPNSSEESAYNLYSLYA